MLNKNKILASGIILISTFAISISSASAQGITVQNDFQDHTVQTQNDSIISMLKSIESKNQSRFASIDAQITNINNKITSNSGLINALTTRVSNIESPPSSLSGTGYYTMPNGLTIQWGQTYNHNTMNAGEGTFYVNFPKPFKNVPFSITIGSKTKSGVVSDAWYYIVPQYTSNAHFLGVFNYSVPDETSCINAGYICAMDGFSWIAIGI